MSTKRPVEVSVPESTRHLASNELFLLRSATPRIVASIGRRVLASLPSNAIAGVGDVEAGNVGLAVLEALERTAAIVLLDGAEADLAKGG